MLNSNESCALGIDLGATKIEGALVTSTGRLLAQERTLTLCHEGEDAVIRRLAAMIASLIHQSPLPIRGIGIGAPGFIDPQAGTVRGAANMNWDFVPLRQKLLPILPLPLPVYIQMDAFASTLGEYYFGAGRGCRNFVYFSIGSGFSAGLYLGGRLITGAANKAGQCGYYSLDSFPPLPGIRHGPHGIAEEIVSGYGILDLTRHRLSEKRLQTALFDSPELDTTQILAAARLEDPLAVSVVYEVGRVFSMVLSMYLSCLNPERIIIGGGLGLAMYDLLLPVIHTELPRRVEEEYIKTLEICPSGQTSSAIGSACLVFQQAEAQ